MTEEEPKPKYILGRYDKRQRTITCSPSKIETDLEKINREALRRSLMSHSQSPIVLLEVKGALNPEFPGDFKIVIEDIDL